MSAATTRPVPVPRTLLALVALCAACARSPVPALPVPQPSPAPAPTPVPAPVPVPAPTAVPDLSGQWQYTATLGGSVITGTLTLIRSGASYTGSATASTADEPLPMASMAFDGTKVAMLFETPNGDAHIEGTVTGGTVINGTVALGDMNGPFRARKQP